MHGQVGDITGSATAKSISRLSWASGVDRSSSLLRALAEAFGVCLVVALFFSPHFVAWRAWRIRPDLFDQCETGRAGVALWQVDHLGEPVEHKYQFIQRWRFLFPAVARAFRLPAVLHLAVYPIGAFLAVAYLSWILQAFVVGWWRLAALTALTANAWFFTSTGWLAYSDGWVALGLLAVAFSDSATATTLACLALPWCDDRFVIGLPVAVAVAIWRLLPGMPASPAAAVRACGARLMPIAVPIALFVATRLAIETRSDVNTLGNHLFPPVADHLRTVEWGGWECLRAAWALVLIAIVPKTGQPASYGLMLTAAGVVSFAAAFFPTYDLSRAGVVLLPLACLGVTTAAGKRPQRWIIPIVAGLNLLLPATHIMVTHAGPSIVPIRGFAMECREYIWPTRQYAPATYIDAAVRQAAEKDFAAADWLLQIARDLRADEGAVARAAALILSETGEADAARQQLEKRLSSHPQDITSAAVLAVLLEEAGRYEEAIVVARGIIDDLPADDAESAAARATAQRVLSRCQEHAP
jgi:hypothetical protein